MDVPNGFLKNASQTPSDSEVVGFIANNKISEMLQIYVKMPVFEIKQLVPFLFDMNLNCEIFNKILRYYA